MELRASWMRGQTSPTGCISASWFVLTWSLGSIIRVNLAHRDFLDIMTYIPSAFFYPFTSPVSHISQCVAKVIDNIASHLQSCAMALMVGLPCASSRLCQTERQHYTLRAGRKPLQKLTFANSGMTPEKVDTNSVTKVGILDSSTCQDRQHSLVKDLQAH